ncbi:MAG: discoidin domain-containing protein [Fibrobacterota bacterium]
MRKNLIVLSCLVLCIAVFVLVTTGGSTDESLRKPLSVEREESQDEEMREEKFAPWTADKAAVHQNLLKEYGVDPGAVRGVQTYAGGALTGEWRNRGAKNMPGAFKFTEMLDGTDTIYGVTWNHYAGEYNSKSYIFKGTVYNPKTGTTGDDFVRLNGHWPNRFQKLIALRAEGVTRLTALVENGPVRYTDDDGKTWNSPSGLPAVIQSIAVNRQNNNRMYATDGRSVYESVDMGESYTRLEDFGGDGDAFLYSPRYAVQAGADNLFLAREGTFHQLNSSGTSFTSRGSYSGAHGDKNFSIGGDVRKLYVSENSKYWVSTDTGLSWTQKFPNGNWYGSREGEMSAGKFLCVHPENPDYVIGGYAQPVFSRDGLDTDVSSTAGWGSYQNGTSLGANAYYDRIRFNYHPDFQSSSFFYNASGDLFSSHSTDGGIFVSYGVWNTATETDAYDNGGYSTADFINLTTLGTVCPLIYRDNLFTGYKDETHIIYSTQDQGTQSIIPGTSGDLLDFYQSIGGDGPPLNSADGRHVWKWDRRGTEVWAPVQMYDGAGNMRSAGDINGRFSSSVTFSDNTTVGWVRTAIDHDQPASRMWVLSRRLDRAEVGPDGGMTGHSVSKGTGHQVTALAQAQGTPDKVWFLQEGRVYASDDRGDSFDDGTATPFGKTANRQNIGSGWVLPGDDSWILFAGPSSNDVGAILSTDGGATWTDVTGNFPAGDDFQVGGMVGTPDGKYVFAGTDIGPWVFVVAEQTWYPVGEGAANFNATAMEYISATNTVRFGTWGSGVWDFTVSEEAPDPFITVTAPNGGEVYTPGSEVSLAWNAFTEQDSLQLSLMQEGTVSQEIATVSSQQESYTWNLPADLPAGEYRLRVARTDQALSDLSDSSFTVQDRYLRISEPAEPLRMTAGERVRVRWESNVDSTLAVGLTRQGSWISTISEGDPSVSAGQLLWDVPDTLEEGDYGVRIISKKHTDLTANRDSLLLNRALRELSAASLSSVSADSEEPGREAVLALDGDPQTFWHTEWSAAQPDFPHSLTGAVDTAVTLAGFTYLPRQDGSSNGRMENYRMEIQSAGQWIPVDSGALFSEAAKLAYSFHTPIKGDRFRVTAFSEHGGSHYVSAAEIGLLYVHEESTPVSKSLQKQYRQSGLSVTSGGSVRITLPREAAWGLTVLTPSGRQVLRRSGRDRGMRISLQDAGISSGVYVLRLESSFGSIVRRAEFR